MSCSANAVLPEPKHQGASSCIRFLIGCLICSVLAERVLTCAVLPDLEHWEDHFAHVKFDGDPTEDVPSLARLSEDDKHRVAGAFSPSLSAI